MLIGGIEKSSLLDYPGKIAAVVFTQGCNLRCDFCHNPELVFPTLFQPSIPESQVFSFLKKRQGKLDAVVITGGEPTLQMDLIDFIQKVRKLGFLVKLDTNGSLPKVLEKIVADKLVDYIAMDIKGPLTKYRRIVCAELSPETVKKSIALIMHSGIPYEFRTTVLKSELTEADFPKIGALIKGAPLYALQKFIIPPSFKINNQAFLKEKTYSDIEFERFQKVMGKYVKKCVVR